MQTNEKSEGTVAGRAATVRSNSANKERKDNADVTDKNNVGVTRRCRPTKRQQEANRPERKSNMDADREDRIRRRAYELWKAHGKVEGRADDFWFQAESEIRGKENGAATGTVTVPLAAD